MPYKHPERDHGRDRGDDADLQGVSYARLDELGSIQWPCNDAAPQGTPIMHVDRFVRGKGQFMLTDYVADRRDGPGRAFRSSDDRPHPVAIQRRRADAAHSEQPHGTRRTCSKSTPSTPKAAASATATSSRCTAAPASRAAGEDHRTDAAGRCLHDVPSPLDRGATWSRPTIPTGRPTVPEYKVTAVQVRRTNHLRTGRIRDREGGHQSPPHRGGGRRCRRVTSPPRRMSRPARLPTTPAPSARRPPASSRSRRRSNSCSAARRSWS